jgi:hypothetical protein
MKMKKLIVAALTGLFLTAIIGVSDNPVQAAETNQVIYVTRCCDAFGYRRCIINPTPIGYYCYCPFQGGGISCL